MEVRKLGSDVQVSFISGSGVEENQTEQRFTVSCDCGGRVFAAKKESSLDYLVNGEKYHATCCGSRYHRSGVKTFNGSNIVEEMNEMEVTQATSEAEAIVTPVENIETVTTEAQTQSEDTSTATPTTPTLTVVPTPKTPKAQKQPKEPKAKPEPKVVDLCGGLLIAGRKGITNAQMIPALRNVLESGESVEEKLTTIYNAHTECFKSAAKYLPDNMKVTLEAFVKAQSGDDSFKLPIGKKMQDEKAGN